MGSSFDLVVDGWISDYPPMYYNVYETLDVNGELLGEKLNAIAVPTNETFKFVVKDYPVMVEVTDQS